MGAKDGPQQRGMEASIDEGTFVRQDWEQVAAKRDKTGQVNKGQDFTLAVY